MEIQLDATITVLLILEINKTIIVASSWSSIFTLPSTGSKKGWKRPEF
jgi:hypothetical protein